jgi:hypothetical protein
MVSLPLQQMVLRRQIQLKTVSLGLALLLAAIWGLRWHHALHGHSDSHEHHHHSHSHDSDGQEGHNHEDCELCKWALAYFEVEEPGSWKWLTISRHPEPVFYYVSPGIESDVTANGLRGPPFLV